jgi:hypothetical protein
LYETLALQLDGPVAVGAVRASPIEMLIAFDQPEVTLVSDEQRARAFTA